LTSVVSELVRTAALVLAMRMGLRAMTVLLEVRVVLLVVCDAGLARSSCLSSSICTDHENVEF
jgi:hypothetical protein